METSIKSDIHLHLPYKFSSSKFVIKFINDNFIATKVFNFCDMVFPISRKKTAHK